MALTRREEKQLRALRQRKIREADGCFLTEGVRAVEDLLASDLAVQLIVLSSTFEDTERGHAMRETALQRGVPVHDVPAAEFTRLVDTQTPQGVLAIAEIPGWTFEDLRPRAEPAGILVLDAVQDPGNFGTLVRTAEAIGAAGVLALPGTVDAWNAKSVRAAMGSSFRLPIVTTTWSEAAAWLRGAGFEVLAAAGGGEPLGTRPPRSALVVGNEGAGISAEILAQVDRVVGIPIRGRAESLNVAAAAAILLYDLLR